jgi:hypothetical protein
MQATNDELERLRSLKRRALDLASSHLEALNVFYLAEDLQPLESLARGPGMVGGFASVVPATKHEGDGSARISLASTAACIRSLLVCPDVKPGNADFSQLIDDIIRRHRSGELSTYGLEHLNVFTVGQLLPAVAEMVGLAGEPDLDALIGDAVSRLRAEVANAGVAIPMKGDPEDAEPRALPTGISLSGPSRLSPPGGRTTATSPPPAFGGPRPSSTARSRCSRPATTSAATPTSWATTC